MTARTEMDLEELIYEIADEIGLTELETRRLDVGRIVGEELVGLRLRVKKEAGQPTVIQDYLLPDPAKVVNLHDALRRMAERTVRHDPQ